MARHSSKSAALLIIKLCQSTVVGSLLLFRKNIRRTLTGVLPLFLALLACGPTGQVVESTVVAVSEARTIKVAEFSGTTLVNEREAELVRLIFSLNDQAQYDQALEILNPMLEENPEDIVALILRARTYSNAGEGELALADAQAGLALEPDNPNLLAAQGGAYFVLNNFDSALESLNRALEIDPDYAVALNNRGIVFYAQGMYEAAVEDYTLALENNPDDANIYLLNRGVAHFELGNSPSRAIEDLSAVIEMTPEDIRAYFNRGNVYFSIQDYQAAIDDYTAGIDINAEGLPDLYYNRGVAYSQINENALAQADWATYTELTGEPAP